MEISAPVLIYAKAGCPQRMRPYKTRPHNIMSRRLSAPIFLFLINGPMASIPDQSYDNSIAFLQILFWSVEHQRRRRSLRTAHAPGAIVRLEARPTEAARF